MNTNLIYKEDLTEKQLYMVQNQYEDKKKKTHVMWLWWFFTAGLGGHNFYLREKGKAWGMIATNLLTTWWTFGLPIFTWIIIDAFLITKRLNKLNEQIERDIIKDVKMITSK